MKNIIKWGLVGFLGLVVLGTIFGDDQETERQAEVNESDTEEQSESDELKSLTEKQRRQIFKEIIAAERRAMAEADELYPVSLNEVYLNLTDPNQVPENIKEMIDKNIDKSRELMEKYRTQVRTKHGITEDLGFEISGEGVRKKWPPLDYLIE